MAAKNLTTDELEKGDIINDSEGGKIKVFCTAGEGIQVVPLSKFGKPIKPKRHSVDADEIQDRLDSGRYEPYDCAATRTSLKEGDLPTDLDTDVYIRFGDVPEAERSTNHIDGSEEAGVSVYAAEATVSNPEADVNAMYVPVGTKLQQILFLARRDTYLVTGDEVGTGTDGEPLLHDVEVVCELTSPKGVSGFVPAGGN